MKQFFTILKFELSYFMKNKVYIGVTVFMVALIAVVLCIPSIANIFKGNGEDEASNKTEILYMEDSGSGAYEYLSAGLSKYSFIKTDMSFDEIREKIAAGEYKYAVEVLSPLKIRLITDSLGMYGTINYEIQEIMTQKYKYDYLNEAGISADEINKFMTAGSEVEVVETGKNAMSNFFYAYVLVFLLYMAILLYGQMVATSVASEKSSRAMELLITTARPNSLMFGKVLGSGIAGLIQLAIVLISSAVLFNLNSGAWGDNEIINSLFNMPAEIIIYMIIFFLTGFFIYAFMYAALGSLAGRMEDINTSIMPITLLFIAGFFVSIFGLMGDPSSLLVKICSYIPFFSPMVMFTRICMSVVPIWEICISVGILLITIVFIGLLSAKIYRMGVLLYGKPPKLGEIFKTLVKSM